MDSAANRQFDAGTRYVETAVGTISYQELAPLLAERVAKTELAIVKRTLTPTTIHDLLLEIHRRICIDLTPNSPGVGVFAMSAWVRIARHHTGKCLC